MGGAEESAEIDCLSASGTSGKRGGKCVMGWPALSWSHLLTSHPPRVTAGPLQARSQWRGEPNEAGHAHLEAAGSAPWWRRRQPACSGSRLPSCHTSSSPSSSPRSLCAQFKSSKSMCPATWAKDETLMMREGAEAFSLSSSKFVKRKWPGRRKTERQLFLNSCPRRRTLLRTSPYCLLP